MTKFENKIEITYRWWNKDNEINSTTQKILERYALRRIWDQLQEGMTEGELYCPMTSDGNKYSGWWEMKEVRIA